MAVHERLHGGGDGRRSRLVGAVSAEQDGCRAKENRWLAAALRKPLHAGVAVDSPASQEATPPDGNLAVIWLPPLRRLLGSSRKHSGKIDLIELLTPGGYRILTLPQTFAE